MVFGALCALVFLGLLARICEMAVLVRWAEAHWDQLSETLSKTSDLKNDDFAILLGDEVPFDNSQAERTIHHGMVMRKNSQHKCKRYQTVES